MFKAYLDESGIHKQVFAIGGIVATEREWAMFTEDWQRVIEPLKIEAYHASDCGYGYGDFKD